MNKVIRIGTRGSKLALVQAHLVQKKLLNIGIRSEVIPIKTTGDKILDKTLYDIGGKALFLKEIEEALIANKVDLAVHSMKDVPAEIPEALIITAILERENPYDVFISKFNDIASLPPGAIVGTSSVRRIVQILAINPHVKIENLRGNIDSRFNKYLNKEYDAIILAAAGLNRLNIQHLDIKIIPIEVMIPAVGQGAIALEVRRDDKDLIEISKKLNHEKSWLEIQAERGFLETIKGDCRTPLGAFAKSEEKKLFIHYFLANNDGSNIRRTSLYCAIEDGYNISSQIASKMLKDLS